MKCLICGRVLKNEKSIKLGYGPVCYRKEVKNIHIEGRLQNEGKQFEYKSVVNNIPGQMCFDNLLIESL